MKRRIILIISLCLSTLLTACGGGGSSSDGSIGGGTTPGLTSINSGVLVDPYIVGANLQEVSADGSHIWQTTTAPTDAQGLFSFGQNFHEGSILQVIPGSGKHVNAAYMGVLKRKIEAGTTDRVIVSPLTTLVANGSSKSEIINLLASLGFTGLTVADIDGNTMNGIENATANLNSFQLQRLQAAIAINNSLDALGNYQLTASDLNSGNGWVVLQTMTDSITRTLNQAKFDEIRSDPNVIGLRFGDQIDVVVEQNRVLVGQLKNDLVQTGSVDTGGAAIMIQDFVANLVHDTKVKISQRNIGAELYASNCASCHGVLASTKKPGRTAAQIQSAIDSNIGNMGTLSALTAAEVQAIADALPAPPATDPNTPPNGAALYADNCSSCHKPLANTSKPGRTAAQIQSAINGNVGNMGFLSTLTTAEVQAIADVLPAPPVVDPGTPPDGAALYASDCSGCHGSLANTTKPGRTAAQIQSAINGNVGGMGFLSPLTTAEVQAIADALPAAPPAPTDGPTLYSNNCAGCHGSLANTTKPGRTAAQIQSAINGNVGGMGFLSTLTTTEVQAIADALPAAPPAPTDGPTLYSNNCAGCHGSLANTTKPGRTAAQIQSAINGNVGGMGFLSTLTTAEVQAIADALPAGNGGPDYSDCTACHGQPPNGTTFPNTRGAHTVHQALPGVGTNCGICHQTAAHNGNVDLAFPAAYNAKSGPATDNLDGTCSNIICHGGQRTPDWWTGTIDVNIDCASCHVRGTTQYNSPNSGQHGRSEHRSRACTVCHNTAKMTNHFGNLATPGFETVPATTVGGGATRVTNYSNGTCTNTCHGSERW